MACSFGEWRFLFYRTRASNDNANTLHFNISNAPRSLALLCPAIFEQETEKVSDRKSSLVLVEKNSGVTYNQILIVMPFAEPVLLVTATASLG